MSTWLQDLKVSLDSPDSTEPLKNSQSPEESFEDHLSSIFTSSSNSNLQPWLDSIESKKVKADQQDPHGYSLLHMSVWFNDFSLTEHLLKDLSLPVNIRSKNNQTPLSLASAKGNLKILKLLLEYGADLEVKDDSGMTPALCAAHNGQVLVWLMLKSKGCNIWVKDNSGNSALHLASSKNHARMIRMLVSQDFSIEETNTLGQTSLHKACESNSLESLQILLHYGASLDVKDLKGRDPVGLSEMVEGPEKMVSEFFNVSWMTEYFTVFYHVFWISIIVTYTYQICQDTLICLGGNLVLSLSLLLVLPLFWIVKKSTCETLHPAEEKSIEILVASKIESGKIELLPKASEICFTCQVIRPMKSKHCKYTDKCILVYDHYNFFLQKPIGKGNQKSYFLGLLMNLISLSLFIYLLYKKLSREVEYLFFSQYFMQVFWNLFGIFPGTLVLVIVSLSYIWTVFWYFVVQVVCISQGITVNEAVNRHRYGYFFEYQQLADSYRVVFVNPHNKGFFNNWLDFLVN
jgi:hypothetical protein